MNTMDHSDARVTELMRLHGPALLNYTTRLMCGDRSAAEDVVQETWLRAWTHSDRLSEDRGSVRGWLTRVAHNIAMDQHRARRARPMECEWTVEDDDRVAAPDDTASSVEARLLVEDLLSHVSASHRDTLTEVYLNDRSTADAADVLGVPVGTVKSRVFTSLRQLRTFTSGFAF